MGDEEQGAPEKVSDSKLANEIVAALRAIRLGDPRSETVAALKAIAEWVIMLGDEHERALEDLERALGELEDEKNRANALEQELHCFGNEGEELEAVYELLEDFRRGIRDYDELLEGTVGR